jgi:3',5'-cyclic AMP phosphodiesterase CpdA
MRLVHLTDLHLPISAPPSLAELLNKRALGYLSWQRNRRFRHGQNALDAIVADAARARPDFTAISGDLVNISLASEFSHVAQWLNDNFDAKSVALVPGNHDAYVAMPWSDGAGAFASFMIGERGDAGAMRAPRDAGDFPFVRSVGEVSLVFANSAPPTAPGLATGRLGREQIHRIGLELARLKAAGQCRVLVLHHPVTEGASPGRKALVDRAALRSALAESGVELVLHGHTHQSVWAAVETPVGPRPVIGGASASHRDAHGKYRPARYNLFTIDGGPQVGWRIEIEVRELDPASGEVKTADRRTLLPGPS